MFATRNGGYQSLRMLQSTATVAAHLIALGVCPHRPMPPLWRESMAPGAIVHQIPRINLSLAVVEQLQTARRHPVA